MKRAPLIVTIALCLLGIFTSTAQEQPLMHLSLENAKSYALEHNKILKGVEKDVGIYEKKVWEAISQGLPQIDVALDYTTQFNYEFDFGFGSSDETSMTQAQMQQYLNLQGVANDQMNAGDYQTIGAMNSLSSMGQSSIIMKDAITAKASVGMLLFNGQYYVGIKTAKIATALAKQNVESTELDIKQLVTDSYYASIITKESLRIINLNIVDLEKVMKHTENMYNAGMAEITDLDQIRITVSQLRNAQLAAKRNLELTYNLLRFQLGLDPYQPIELTAQFNDLLDETAVLATSTSTFTIEQNITYKMMENQEELSRKMIDLEKWSYGPQLTGYYAYNEKLLSSGFDMTPNNVAGLSLTVPIFSSGLRKSKLDQAKIQLEKSELNKSLLSDQLLLEERQLRYILVNSIENYNLQKENQEVASRVLANMTRKYEHGTISSLDLTQANSNYLTAQSNYITATLEVLQARLNLEKLLNTL